MPDYTTTFFADFAFKGKGFDSNQLSTIVSSVFGVAGFIGSSRSGVADFQKTVDMYVEHPEIIDYLGNIVSSVNVVRTTSDIKAAFEKDTQKGFGKTIMKWEE